MNRITLYEEYKLIERNETEINVAWKGAHLLLFFLAFVFGSFCTFCFHVLMYMFDQKCVLFPTITRHPDLRHIVYEYLSIKVESSDKPKGDNLPLDFVSTSWVDNSVCYLPTYVPLISGLFGLIWTSMFLMCSSGTSTGMQRQWRTLPVIFIFSLAMGALCIYASTITHNGLRDLCTKLANITGSASCTYTVNVASLAYERRIRGVYQATQLTIITAWLHTFCWLASALMTTLRVLFAVDFQLVCVRADLIGNVERMLEKYEKQIRFITPESTVMDYTIATGETASFSSLTSLKFQKRETDNNNLKDNKMEFVTIGSSHKLTELYNEQYFTVNSTVYSQAQEQQSEMVLVADEQFKLARHAAYNTVSKKHRFIVRMLYDVLEKIDLPYLPTEYYFRMDSDDYMEPSKISRQMGRADITAAVTPVVSMTPEEAAKIANEIKESIRAALARHFSTQHVCSEGEFIHNAQHNEALDSNIFEFDDLGHSDTPIKEEKTKSNLKRQGSPTVGTRKVKIVDGKEPKDDSLISIEMEQFSELSHQDEDGTHVKNEEKNKDNKTNAATEVKKLSVDKESQTRKEKQD